MTLKEYTERIIRHYLREYNNNVLKVAKKLDIGKSTIYNLLRTYSSMSCRNVVSYSLNLSISRSLPSSPFLTSFPPPSSLSTLSPLTSPYLTPDPYLLRTYSSLSCRDAVSYPLRFNLPQFPPILSSSPPFHLLAVPSPSVISFSSFPVPYLFLVA